jgi:hypothetical protein
VSAMMAAITARSARRAASLAGDRRASCFEASHRVASASRVPGAGLLDFDIIHILPQRWVSLIRRHCEERELPAPVEVGRTGRPLERPPADLREDEFLTGVKHSQAHLGA